MIRARFPLLLALAAGTLAACIPVVVAPSAAPGPATPGLAFTTATLQVETGETVGLSAMLRDGGAAPSAAAGWRWQVSDPTVAAVDGQGLLKGLKTGSAVVTVVSAADPSRQATLNVSVVNNKSAVQIRLSPSSVVLEPGEQQALEAAVHLADGTINHNVQWSSSDDTIASVNNSTGTVTALKLGRVTIRATYPLDGSHQVVDVQIVEDKAAALPSAMPSAVVFGEGQVAEATPAPLGRWLRAESGIEETLRAVDFVDADTGFAMGDKGVLIATTDGGATWTDRTPLSLAFQDVSRCDFGSAEAGMAVTADRRLHRTQDGGATWEAVPGAEFCEDVLALDAQKWYAVWGGQAHRSLDGGESWEALTVPLAERERASGVGAWGDRVWIAVGAKIYREVPGTGWTSTFAAPNNQDIRLRFVSETFGFVTGGSGLFVTRDGGATFTGVAGGPAIAAWAGPSHGWRVEPLSRFGTASQILATEDGGATWLATPFDTEAPAIHALAFAGRQAGWAVGTGGAVYRYQPRP